MTKILVTGGAGFIGSHLVDSLLQDGHDVYVIDDLSTGQLANVEHLRSHPRFHLVVDTIMHHATVNELVHKCDIVYHLAAAVGVRLIVERPAHTLSTNVRGTDIVMELCARFNRRVLIASPPRSTAIAVRRSPSARTIAGSTVPRPSTAGRTRPPRRSMSSSPSRKPRAGRRGRDRAACSTRSAHARRVTTAWSCRASSRRRSPASRSRSTATARRRAASSMSPTACVRSSA